MTTRTNLTMTRTTRTTDTRKDSANNDISRNNAKFLGIVNKQYLKTFPGLVHGVGSLMALLLGNIVFFQRVVLGRTFADDSAIEVVFHASNFGASMTTALFFWDKVQSWQLSKTSMEEKGLTPRILRNLNRGRGVVSMLLFSLFPLLCGSLRSLHLLESKTLSTVVALTLIAGSISVHNLLREYLRHLWLAYGMTPMALGVSILCCSRDGTVASTLDDYPLVSDRFEKEAAFVISCVQMGFLTYYLYSRNLITKANAQKICKVCHGTFGILFLLRVQRDIWLQHTASTTPPTALGLLPWPMMIHPMILTVSQMAAIRETKDEAPEMTNNENPPDAPEAEQSGPPSTPKMFLGILLSETTTAATTTTSPPSIEEEHPNPKLRRRRSSTISPRIESACQ